MNPKFPTVGADGHLEENHIDWKERLPEKYKDKAPQRIVEHCKLSDAAKKKIFNDNARRLYPLD